MLLDKLTLDPSIVPLTFVFAVRWTVAFNPNSKVHRPTCNSFIATAQPVVLKSSISVCAREGQWKSAMSLLAETHGAGVTPQLSSLSADLAAIRKSGRWEQALTLLEEVTRMAANLESHPELSSAQVAVLKCLSDKELLSHIPTPTVAKLAKRLYLSFPLSILRLLAEVNLQHGDIVSFCTILRTQRPTKFCSSPQDSAIRRSILTKFRHHSSSKFRLSVFESCSTQWQQAALEILLDGGAAGDKKACLKYAHRWRLWWKSEIWERLQRQDWKPEGWRAAPLNLESIEVKPNIYWVPSMGESMKDYSGLLPCTTNLQWLLREDRDPNYEYEFALDCEWRNPRPVSLVQISVRKTEKYTQHRSVENYLFCMKNASESTKKHLGCFFEDDANVILCFSPLGDWQRLYAHGLSDHRKVPAHWHDLQNIEFERSGRHPSLQAMMQGYCDYQLDKEVQTSDWDVRPLSARQVNYAALDAEILFLLWDTLANRTDTVFEKVGDKIDMSCVSVGETELLLRAARNAVILPRLAMKRTEARLIRRLRALGFDVIAVGDRLDNYFLETDTPQTVNNSTDCEDCRKRIVCSSPERAKQGHAFPRILVLRHAALELPKLKSLVRRRLREEHVPILSLHTLLKMEYGRNLPNPSVDTACRAPLGSLSRCLLAAFNVDGHTLMDHFILSRCVGCNGNMWQVITEGELDRTLRCRQRALKVFRDVRVGKALDHRGEKVKFAVTDTEIKSTSMEAPSAQIPRSAIYAQCCGCGEVNWEGPPDGEWAFYNATYVRTLFPELGSFEDVLAAHQNCSK